MGCNIYIKEKLIIDCSAGMLETLYYAFEEYLENNQLLNNHEIKNLLHQMFVAKENMCVYGFDFGEHIHNPSTIDLLSHIIDMCLPNLKNILKPHAIDYILKLKEELLLYKKDL